MSATRKLRLIISGRVQGVWYRESMRQEALRLGVDGWVRNRADGTVEAVISSQAAHVEALLAWARTGPPLAQVAEVRCQDYEGEVAKGFAKLPSA